MHHLEKKQKNPKGDGTKKRIPTGRRIPTKEESKRADSQKLKQEESKFNRKWNHPTKKEKNPKGGSR
jgi:hypothetical protein